MKSPVTEVTVTPELVEQLAGSMRLDISDMPIEEIQTGTIKELNNMQVYTIQALDHHRLVRAFNTAYNNISENPTFYTNPEEDPGEFGHPLVGQQGTQFDKHTIMETLIKEELGKILDESRKKLHMPDFVKLPKERQFRKNWLRINGEKLGEGSSRAVYVIDSSKVLKQAINDKGVAQNEAELKTFTNPHFKPLVTEIYDYDPDGEWLVSEIVRPLTGGEFEKQTGLNFNDFVDAVHYLEGVEYTNRQGELAGEKDADNKFVQAAHDLMRFEDLGSGDLFEESHWGKTADGRIVVLDYGFTGDVYRKHYRPEYDDSGTSDMPTVGPGGPGTAASSDTIHRRNVAARKP